MRRYFPAEGDTVVGQVMEKKGEVSSCWDHLPRPSKQQLLGSRAAGAAATNAQAICMEADTTQHVL